MQLHRNNRGKKGVSTLLASVLLVLISVVVAVMVSGFITNISSERSKRVQNLTQTKFACQYASLYVINVTYDCNNDCFTGSPYRINATLQNSGSTSLEISTMQISLDTGEGYAIVVNSSSLSTGSIETKNFNNIIVNSSPLMPIGTMDNRNAYANDSNTVALWHFDDSSGNSLVDSAGGNTGTVMNSPIWNSSGRFGYALTFDGINDFVNVSDSSGLNLTTAYTIEAWISVATFSNSAILDKDNGYAIEISNMGILSVWHNGTRINSTSALSANTLYHIAATYNGNVIKLYINGVENASSTGTTMGLTRTARVLLIGVNNSANVAAAGTYFNGTIDEVRISNIARTFTTTLNYTVSYPNIAYVRLFNQSNQQEASATLSGANYYSNQLTVNTAADYRVEVEDTGGNKIEKWYPYRQGGSCKKTTNLDKVVFSTNNCPEMIDTFYGNDVTFVNCV